MNRTRAGLTLVAALALVAPRGASAADTPLAAEPYGEVVDVRVVNVDVTVTDRDGQPVSDLGRDDFEVYEDGTLQPVTNFFRVDGTRMQGEGGDWQVINADSSFRRRVLLLIDDNFIETPDRNRAIEALQSYLDQKFDGSYEWGVVAVGDEIHVLEPFTADKLRVRAALDRVKSLPTFGARYRLERFVLNDPLRTRAAQRAEAASSGGQDRAQNGETHFAQALRFESKVNVAETKHAFALTAQAMVQAFHAYANLPGNKVLVWITGGVPMLPEYGFEGEQLPPGALSQRDADLRGYQMELRKLVAGIAEEANAAQFKVYPVKATGVMIQTPQGDVGYRSSGATFSESAFHSQVEVDDSDSAQLSVALGTGGLYLTSNNTLDSFERADRDSATYYSLGYRPDRREDGKSHAVRVVVKRPGLVARARSNYVDLGPEKKLELALATPLPFARDKGTLPVAVSTRLDMGEVLATVELPNSRLTFLPDSNGRDMVGKVKIYLTVHDAQGNLVNMVEQEQGLKFPSAQRDEALAGQFRYGLKFRLPKRGNYVVSITLRDEVTSEMGAGYSNVKI